MDFEKHPGCAPSRLGKCRNRKAPREAGGFVVQCVARLDNGDAGSLQALGALLDGELHLLTLFQVPETVTLDGREVDEHIRAAFALDEAVALAAVEPLDRTCNTF